MSNKKGKNNKSPAGRKSAWEEIIQPNLDKIREMYDKGSTEQEIISMLGITKSTFYKYKAEKTELKDIEKDSRVILVDNIKNAMYKKAVGFEYKEKKNYWRKPRGEKGEKPELIYTEEYTRYQAPDTAAQLILLQHWDKENKWTRDPQTYELKEKQFKLDAVKTIKDNWIDDDDIGRFERILDIMEGREDKDE